MGFLQDIGKALYGLHLNCISHQDSRLDNIGIYNNNFVLYDFDGAYLQKYYNFDKDIYDLKKSLKYNLEKEFKKIESYMCFTTSKELLTFMVSMHMSKNKSFKDVINNLDNLNIIY